MARHSGRRERDGIVRQYPRILASVRIRASAFDRPFTSASSSPTSPPPSRARRTSHRPPRRRRSRWRRRVVRSGRFALRRARRAPRRGRVRARRGVTRGGANGRAGSSGVTGTRGRGRGGGIEAGIQGEGIQGESRSATATDADAETPPRKHLPESTSSEILTCSARSRASRRRDGDVPRDHPSPRSRERRVDGTARRPTRRRRRSRRRRRRRRERRPPRRRAVAKRPFREYAAVVGVAAKTRSVHAVGDRVVGLCFCALNAPVVVAGRVASRPRPSPPPKPRAIRGGVRGEPLGDARTSAQRCVRADVETGRRFRFAPRDSDSFVGTYVVRTPTSRDERVDCALRRAVGRPRRTIPTRRDLVSRFAGRPDAPGSRPGEDSRVVGGFDRAREKTKPSRRSDRTSSSFARPPPRTFPDELRAVRDRARRRNLR